MQRFSGVCIIGWLIFGAIGAQADCGPGKEPFSSCEIEGKNTEVFVCFDAHFATYTYGPIGDAPALMLAETIAKVDFEPWSGVGKAISESVTFYNGGYSYKVVGGFHRPFSEEEMALGSRRFGWIEVGQNGTELARLACDPDTVTYGFGEGIYDAKVNTGLIWDDRRLLWVPDPELGAIGPQFGVLKQGEIQGVVEDCLPMSEFALGGIAMGAPVGTLGKFGTPEASGIMTLGGQEVDRISHPTMQVDILDGTVIGMVGTAENWAMPSGVRAGMSRDDVVAVLGRLPQGAEATAQRFLIQACPDKAQATAQWYAVISFGPDDRVQSVSLASLAP